ncbi:MAG: tetratricopeptide repeat protein [Chloroflexota bacterium]
MNERRRFGPLEIIFLLLTLGYGVYAFGGFRGDPGGDRAATPVLQAPTPTPSDAQRLTDLERTTPNTLDRLLERAALRMAANDPGAALADYNLAIEDYSGQADAYLARGDFYFEMGAYANAWDDYATALTLPQDKTSEDFTRFTRYGKIEAARGNLDAARPRFSGAVRQNPDDAEAWYQWGLLEANAGNTPDAYDYFARAAGITPNNPTYQTAYADTLAAQGSHGSAVEVYTTALTADPLYLPALRGRAK